LRSPRFATRLGIALAAVVLVAAGCGGNDDSGAGGSGGGSGSGSGPARSGGALTVFAAASLTEAFNSLKPDFEAANNVKVTYNFAGSQALVGQIQQGAPADVFASADTKNMDKLVSGGKIDGQASTFAGNVLAIVVAKGNPEGVKTLADLARTDLKVVLAAGEVPAGKYAKQALDAQKVTVKPVSLEDNVKSALNKVVLGEADASIVYATDASSAKDKVDTVEIPAEQNVPATYPVAMVKDAKNAAAAKAFVDYLTSEAGQSKLARFGFLPANGA
jgi:molybdate transport system substrate-binding protein